MTQLMLEERIDHYVTLNSQTKLSSSSGSITQRGIRGPMDIFVMDIEHGMVEDYGGNNQQPSENEARDKTSMDIGRLFFKNIIAFNVAKSPSFIKMCRSIGNFGCGLKPPIPYELSTTILNAEEENTIAIVSDVKKTWTQTGVSIRMVFLKSVDASTIVKDATLLFKLLDEVVEEVGEDIVVQVVTDNASNYKKAGEQLHIQPRIGVSFDEVLHKERIDSCRSCTISTAYLTLECMFSLKQPLEQMFTSKEWDRCSWANKLEGREVKKIIIRDNNFWSSISYSLKTTRPLVSVLRMTDSEKKCPKWDSFTLRWIGLRSKETKFWEMRKELTRRYGKLLMISGSFNCTNNCKQLRTF
ncbi:hypothetical protein Dsin_016594 [Dipteronia sinensis]|uniref:DUF659 domain-containing protein n=1 Tax=Dipteronia sinensis TaxID=43782 RepID=A0AAE0AED0_9ROSI|nr:hypothetical protein Dsin_016594 [Dipteronia sinensis]